MQKEELLKQLGAHIRKLREERNLSQSDLAASIGKDQQSIQRLEAGKINPTFYYLHQIAEGLSVNVNELTNFVIENK
ncbi:MAG: helix-turn-helix domain-containing protein [Ignavibacteria bacterium]|nr:helix-turn-helix domain-containing protein [Ignavibacteria bacterium]